MIEKVRETFFLYETSNYQQEALTEFEEELSSLGFKRIYSELGGGVSPEQIIAFIIMIAKDLSIGMASTLLASRIEKSLSKLFEWSKRNKLRGRRKPAVLIRVVSEKESKVKSVTFRIDKPISVEEIRFKFEEAKSITQETTSNNHREKSS